MDEREYDLIVIGAGPVGENVADRAVQGGLTAVIVESELVGGECSYWACVPSKTLLRAGAALQSARDVPGAREAISGDLDVAAVLRRRDEMTSHWRDDGQVAWLDSAGIDLVRGHGRLDGPRRVIVETMDAGTVTLTARHAVAVCTGSAALMPGIPGLRDIEPWTSREATSVQEVPASLAIVGGGVVAVEMATAFASLRTEVTMIVRHGLLGGFETFAGDAVGDALRAAGVRIREGSEVASARRSGTETTLALTDGSEVTVAKVLVATGRVPRTADVGIETVGLTPGNWLDVDDTMQVTGIDGLYAVGDVNHRALLTHQGKYQARAAGDVIAARALSGPVDAGDWGTHAATADHAAVPQVVFTDPEVAAVGLTAAEAEDRGIRTRVLDVDLSSLAGASTRASDYRGRARAIVDTDREVLVGATLVGPDVAELLQAATIAVVGEVPLVRLWHAVPAYPTLSEVWLRWLEAYGRPEA
ncbi:dihydrolipoyl dehydrogenase family protein [Microbacterium invictum]|uniref:Dihydrolipoamide dehydrogenase n=1 Tax=Microbacterium invictum TaxID=515415 RepID=A0AA40SPD9_9MICO|nr:MULTISPECIES: NAD(P)/FAD-dependent oxidoreductase [Microbacterium]MBB4139901.1 dihydrolipoamide dehydrogenase [Microbacterium invictum]